MGYDQLHYKMHRHFEIITYSTHTFICILQAFQFDILFFSLEFTVPISYLSPIAELPVLPQWILCLHYMISYRT